MAQLGSALPTRRGRRFKSCQPDGLIHKLARGGGCLIRAHHPNLSVVHRPQSSSGSTQYPTKKVVAKWPKKRLPVPHPTARVAKCTRVPASTPRTARAEAGERSRSKPRPKTTASPSGEASSRPSPAGAIPRQRVHRSVHWRSWRSSLAPTRSTFLTRGGGPCPHRFIRKSPLLPKGSRGI